MAELPVDELREADEWQRRIKGSAVRLLPGGHMLIHESPDAAATAVTEFAK